MCLNDIVSFCLEQLTVSPDEMTIGIEIDSINVKVLTVEWAINDNDAPESNNTLTGVELIENVP